MFRKKLINLTAFIVLILCLLGVLVIKESLEKPKVLTASKIGIDASLLKNAESLIIKHGKEELYLQKKGSGWTVNGKTADKKKIGEFIQSLSSMVIESELGSVKSRERDFSLDRLSRYELRVKSGSKTLKLYFGKIGPVLHSRYLLVPGDDRVYLVSGVFADQISDPEVDWREKRLIELSGLESLSVETTSASWSIKFKASSAVISYKDKKIGVTGEEFERLKLDLEGVRADNFIDKPGAKEVGILKQPIVRVVLEYRNKRKELVFAKKDNDYYIAGDNEVNWVYLVPYFNLDVFLGNPLEAYGKGQN